ncbi:hypothetical protein [Flavobacterium sp. N502540]|nr:hypothetical protein [Flavobacterium sp. N502540]
MSLRDLYLLILKKNASQQKDGYDPAEGYAVETSFEHRIAEAPSDDFPAV